MPEFSYRGRDREGRLRLGERFATNLDALNIELSKEGISPIQITQIKTEQHVFENIRDWMQGEAFYLNELAIFARQMQLLHDAGVPMDTSLKQLAAHTRSHRLGFALKGLIEYIEKGQSLAVAMQHFPAVFSQLMINIVMIGENTGHLSEAFGHIHQYLDFEAKTIKQVKSSFRYPIFILLSIIIAFITLNIFVIPTFARFYTNMEVTLPWQTRFLIGFSNFTVHYGWLVLIIASISLFFFYKYIKTPKGKYVWDKFLFHLPFFGGLLKRIILIRFSESLAIMLNSGIIVNQGLFLVKNVILNNYIVDQISQMLEAIEHGVPFTQALVKVELFTALEIQILAVGEKNGELSPALNFIAKFHTDEIVYDLKRINDLIGPVLLSAISILILVVALGIYLPIWNMINLMQGAS